MLRFSRLRTPAALTAGGEKRNPMAIAPTVDPAQNHVGGSVRVLNEVQSTPLGETVQGHVEGVVRVRGFEAAAAGRSFGFQRYEPEAVIIRGEDDLRRLPVAAPPNSMPAMALPVAVYVAARLLMKRRRGR
jgi:hypothetical protein